MYAMEVFLIGTFESLIGKIMRSMGTWAFLAFLGALITIARAYPGCGYHPPSSSCHSCSNHESPIPCGAEIVTYGEPCFCKTSIPYSIEVPKTVPAESVEPRKSYEYSVITPPCQSAGRSLTLPLKIQTPVIEKSYDTLRGKSYGVAVQHKASCPGPRSYTFDLAIQTPVQAPKPVCKPSMSVEFEHFKEREHPHYSPLPFSIQTPVEHHQYDRRLTGLTTTVDKVLVPACECSEHRPDCNDVRVETHQPTYLPCY